MLLIVLATALLGAAVFAVTKRASDRSAPKRPDAGA